MPHPIPIHGWVAPGFEAVEVELRRHFAGRGEVGAACGRRCGMARNDEAAHGEYRTKRVILEI